MKRFRLAWYALCAFALGFASNLVTVSPAIAQDKSKEAEDKLKGLEKP